MKLFPTQRQTFIATVCICTLSLGGAATAFADPIQPAANSAGIGYYINADLVLFQGQTLPITSDSFASYSGCTVSTATLTACASSFATVGRLGNKASIMDTNPSGIAGQYESSNGFSWFRDVLTIDGLVNGAYTIVPTVTIHGNSSWNGVLGAVGFSVGVGLVEWSPDGTTVAQSLNYGAPSPIFLQSFQLQGIPFEPNVPFNFMVGFGVAAFISNPTAVPNPPTSTYVSADFLSTMSVTNLKVLDSAGDSVADFAVQSASGALYTGGGISPVPEPPLLSLLSAGVLVLLGRMRARTISVAKPRSNTVARYRAG